MRVGEKLREARKEKELSIAEIEERTKIRKKYLRELENNNFEPIPGEVYIKAFIREYAQVVGLDGDNLVDEYRSFIKAEQEDEHEKEIEEADTWLDKWKENKIIKVVILIILLTFISVFIYFWFGNKESPQGEPSSNIEQTVTQTEENNLEEVKEEEKIEENIEKENENNTSSVNNKVYKLIAEDRSWLQVMVDGELIFKGFIGKGEEKIIQVNKSINLKIGNGHAIKIDNGEEILGPWGEEGEVIKKELTVNNDT